MKIRDLIGRLENCNPDAEIEIYLHHDQETTSMLEDHVYILCEVEINTNTGWYGLVTLEPGEIRGF